MPPKFYQLSLTQPLKIVSTVARHAQAILENEAPEALDAALTELATLTADFPTYTPSEKDHPFTECASFADEIKSHAWWQSQWHYDDQPYLDQGGSLSDFSFKAPEHNVVLALESLSGFLKGTIAPDSDYYTHEIAWSFENVADQRSFALRLLIHYVGDLHQPLHAVSEVDN